MQEEYIIEIEAVISQEIKVPAINKQQAKERAERLFLQNINDDSTIQEITISRILKGKTK